MTISHQDAAAMLSEYLSVLFRAEITVPIPNSRIPEVRQASIQRFVEHLPKVVQRAVDGAELKFHLPLVQGSKGTSLSPQVAQTISILLFEAVNLSDPPSSDDISVPTFFYNDGSTMVIVFNPMMLAIAVQMMVQNAQVTFFVKNSIIKARG